MMSMMGFRHGRHRRLLLVLAAFVLLVGATILVWRARDWPPPMLLLIHGEAPAGGPTGRTFKHDLGMEFVEFSPGCYRVGSHIHCTEGDFPGRLSRVLHLSFGEQPSHRPDLGECPPEWIDVERSFWITRAVVTPAQFRAFRPGHRQGVKGSQPALSLRWREAGEYCRWLWNGERGSFRLPSEAELHYALLHDMTAPPLMEWLGERSMRQTSVFLGTRYRKATDEDRDDLEGLRGIYGKRRSGEWGPSSPARLLAGPDTMVPSVSFRIVFIPEEGAEDLWPEGIPRRPGKD